MGKNSKKFNRWPHTKTKAMVYDCPVGLEDLYIILLLCELFQELEPLHEMGLIPDKMWPEMKAQDVANLWMKLSTLEEQIDGDVASKCRKEAESIDKQVRDLFSHEEFAKCKGELS